MPRRSQTKSDAVDPSIPFGHGVADRTWSPRELVVLLAIVAVGVVLRLWNVEQWSFAADETRTWQGLTAAVRGPMDIFAGEQGRHPLVLLGLRWLLDSGLLPFHGEGWLRLPFVFAGVTTVPLLALVGKKVVGDGGVALTAAALLAVHPWHVALSQTAAPGAFVLLFTLGALGAAVTTRHRPSWLRHLLCALCIVLAVGSAAAGWLSLPLLAAWWLARRWQDAERRAAIACGAMLLFVPLLPALGLYWSGWTAASGDERAHDVLAGFLQAVRWPMAILAVAAVVVWRPLPAAACLAIAATLVSACLTELVAVPLPIDALAVVVPLSCLLAAQTCWQCFTFGRAGFRAEGRAAMASAALVPAALLVSLFVDSALHVSVYEGQRSPWRSAARLATDASESARGVLVGAGSGWSSLVYYLRRNHWRGVLSDPHPGIRVDRLDLDEPAVALREFVASARGQAVVLVLRRDELTRVEDDAVAKDLLWRSFRLVEVLATAFRAGSETLYVFRAVDPSR